MGFERFTQAMAELLAQLPKQKEQIQKAGELVAQTIQDGGNFYTFGTGHSFSIALEAVGKRGSLPQARLMDEHIYNLARFEKVEGLGEILLRDLPMGPLDVAMVASNSGRNPMTIEVGQGVKARGASLITISALSVRESTKSLHSNGRFLSDFADVALDNLGTGDDLLLDGYSGSPSTIMGLYLYYAVFEEALDRLDRGVKLLPL